MDDGCRGARECLDAVKPTYDAARAEGKAVGLGLALKNSGLGNGFVEISRSVVRFEDDGTVEVRHCWTEMGQGVHTVALQVAVEELGIDPDRIRVVVDTTRELGAGQTTGSRGTLMASGSVADACKAALADGCRTGIDYPGEFRVDWTNHLGEPGVEHPIIHSAFGYAAQVAIVDRDSGAVEKVVAAHDVGRAVNPLLCVGQIEGAVLPVVLSEVLGNGSQGGLSAIVAKLQQAGLGEQVKSWIGNGQNLPITAEQLQQVLGSDTVKQLAARYNIPVDQITQILAQQLPKAGDHASPDGKLPHTA